jgi:hypothetical protein
MKTGFHCFGHPNITATHRTTLELTEDGELTKEGTCIIGVGCKIPSLQDFLHKDKVVMTIAVGKFRERVVARPNRGFRQGRELVVRKSDFVSARTMAINADRAAADLEREMVQLLKNPEQEILVEISDDEKDTA